MKKILITLTLLLTSTVTMAKNDSERANKAVKKAVIIKIKEKLQPYKKPTVKMVTTRLKNKFANNGKPSNTVKSVGAFIKVVKELSNPEYTHKTIDSETKIRVLQFKSLAIDYKATDSDLNFNFKTDGKETSFGLNMSF